MTPKAGAKFLPQWHLLNMCQGGTDAFMCPGRMLK